LLDLPAIFLSYLVVNNSGLPWAGILWILVIPSISERGCHPNPQREGLLGDYGHWQWEVYLVINDSVSRSLLSMWLAYG
jgi:hypothetical protein